VAAVSGGKQGTKKKKKKTETLLLSTHPTSNTLKSTGKTTRAPNQ
jgi:hypothetical protein